MRLRLKEPMDGSSLIFCGIEFQIVGAANLKALRPTTLAVKGTCNRLSEVERRGLGGLLRLISDVICISCWTSMSTNYDNSILFLHQHRQNPSISMTLLTATNGIPVYCNNNGRAYDA